MKQMSLDEFCQEFPAVSKVLRYFEVVRFGGRPTDCLKCGAVNRVSVKTAGFYRCLECKGTFSIRTGTMLESFHIPLNKWLLAMYLFTTSRKGISSIQLGKVLGITQKSSWFLLQRLPELYEFTGLTHAMYQAVQFQAMETYKSFTALLIKAVRKEIWKLQYVLTETGRKTLFQANLRNEWFTNSTLKSIVFQLVKTGKISFPRLKNTNTIKLTENVCQVNKTKTATGFEYFVHISLSDDIKKQAGITRCLIMPLNDSSHFLAKSKHADKVLDSVQLNMANMTVTLTTKAKSVEKRETGADIGLVNALTSSDGSRYGQGFQQRLLKA
ncbi:MAG: hypothetical protein QM571_03130 [Micrococcaceae bacterium]